jgi:FSR family fosmidomycin resistance protein-like MFS transporter
MRRRQFLVHSLTHLVNDLYTGFLPPLLPLLCARHGLSLTGAGILVSIQTLAASLSQPLWGMASDKHPARWYAPVGVFTAGLFFGMIGLAPGIASLVAVIFLGGLGTACFHPMGTHLATALTSRRKGLAIALYITAGASGYALGPVLISQIVGIWGLGFTLLGALPVLVVVPLWMFLGPKSDAYSGNHHALRNGEPRPPVAWKAIALLTATSTIRAFVLLTFLSFLPFHLEKLGIGLQTRAIYLFALQFGDVLGNLIGGGLSDRLGRWRVMFWTPILAPLLFLAFLKTPGFWALLPLFIAAILIFASAPGGIVSAQKMMVRREGLASALQIGFAWGLAGLFMGLVGRAAELFTVYRVLYLAAFLPWLMVVFFWCLKPYRPQFEAEPREEVILPPL